MQRRFILFKADEGTGGSGGGGETGSGSGGSTTETPPEGTGGSQEQTSSGNSTDEGLAKELADTRREAAKFRTELREAQKKVEQLEGEKKSDLEKAQEGQQKAEKTVDEVTQKLRNVTARAIAAEVGVTKDAVADVASLLSWDKIEDPDDDKQVEKAIRALVKDKPYLLGTHRGRSDGGAGGNRGGEKTDFNQQIRERAGRA